MVDKVDVRTMATMLAYFAERRGRDSWGVVKQNKLNGEPTIIKDIGSIHKTCRIPMILAPQVIAHTRAATVGAISKRNAHPFHVGNIIGAHNGHVMNHVELNKKYSRTCQVDSEHIFHQINEDKPIEELSGSGTITFIDLREPGKVFFGRGGYSDLEIFSLGPTEKPWGTMWASIAMWGTDALEMAGITEYDTWDTHLATSYELEDHWLHELGDFNLRTVYTPTPRQEYSYTPPRCHQSGPIIPKIYDHENRVYIESKTMEEYWGRMRENQVKAGTLHPNDVESLPASLKKNPEVSILGQEQRQDKEAIETSIQCDGCSVWGRVVDDYAEHADGIVEHCSIDEWLCYQCSCFWGQQTSPRRAANQPSHELDVPKLSLNMEY